MAVTVSVWHFARLKLRITANGLRGAGWRVALFVLGLVFGLGFAATGFVVFAAPGLLGDPQAAGLVAGFGGALLVLGWLFLPLVFFGVDESLDPARFALLPLHRRTLITGLFTAALIGVPALATLIATTGLIAGAAGLGGAAAALAAAAGVVVGLLTCVAVSRAVTSAFATALRSRRARDLAAILLAVVAALLGPLQIVVLRGAEAADWARFAGIAEVIGWTPLAAPYTIGLDVAEGRAWAVPVKLLISAATVGGLLWWWSRSLETAMLGAASSGSAKQADGPVGGPVDQLFPSVARWLPRSRFGALTAREMRYWWREARRRASLITFTVVGVFLPVMVGLGTDGTDTAPGHGDVPAVSLSLAGVTASLLFVGILAALSLANQFGFDGNAYAANVVAGVPGRIELHSRVAAYSAYLLPVLLGIAVLLGVLLDRPQWIPALLGALLAAYGTGLAVVLSVSVRAAYALPDTANPFAVNSGGGAAKSMLSFAALLAGTLATAPFLLATFLLGDVWLWLALPVGAAYGAAAYAAGAAIAAAMLDRRMPELLATVGAPR